LAFIGGLSLLALGLLLGSLGLVASPFESAENQLMLVTLSISIVALGAGLGSALAWQAFQALLRRKSGPFRPGSSWLLGLIYLLALLCGTWILGQDPTSILEATAFACFYVAGAILPGLTVVTSVGRNLSGTSRWRDIVVQISSGAFLSTTLAFTLEFALIVALVVAALALIALQPGGIDQIQALTNRLADPSWAQDPGSNMLTPRLAAEILKSPRILLTALFVFTMAVPLLEESVKTVGVGLMAYRRPTMAQSYLWGLASGAGFALAEALFNSLAGLNEWGAIVILRVGATLLHCFTGALMGLAWYALLAERRWGRALRLFVASVGLHGLWNALAAVMVYLALASIGDNGASAEIVQAQTGTVAVALLLAALTTAVIVGLVIATRYVRRFSPA
jgi:hypothetical protein